MKKSKQTGGNMMLNQFIAVGTFPKLSPVFINFPTGQKIREPVGGAGKMNCTNLEFIHRCQETNFP